MILLKRDDNAIVYVNIDHIVAIVAEADVWCSISDTQGNTETFMESAATVAKLVAIARRERSRGVEDAIYSTRTDLDVNGMPR